MASADDVVVPPHIPITRRLVDAPPPKKKAKADKNELDNADEATHEYDSADLAFTSGKAPCVGAGATTHMSLTRNKRYALKARLWRWGRPLRQRVRHVRQLGCVGKPQIAMVPFVRFRDEIDRVTCSGVSTDGFDAKQKMAMSIRSPHPRPRER